MRCVAAMSGGHDRRWGKEAKAEGAGAFIIDYRYRLQRPQRGRRAFERASHGVSVTDRLQDRPLCARPSLIANSDGMHTELGHGKESSAP